MKTHFLAGTLCLLIAGSEVFSQTTRAGRSPTSRKTTQPATRPTPQITADAKIVLDRIDALYSKLQGMSFTVQITGQFDIAGRKQNYLLNITSLTDGAGRFIHRAENIGVIQQTAKALCLYDQKRNAYGYLISPATRSTSDNLQQEVIDILIDENPSLLMMLVTDPSKVLSTNANQISLEGPILKIEDDESVRKYQFDAAGYIQSVEIDFTTLYKQRNTQNINAALVTITYPKTELNMSITDDAFDFVPPENAAQSDLIRETGHSTSQPTTKNSTSDNEFSSQLTR